MSKPKHQFLVADDQCGKLSLIYVLDDRTEVHLSLNAGTTMDQARVLGAPLKGRIVAAEIRPPN